MFSEIATIKSFELTEGGIYCARLRLAETSDFNFNAGQYLLLVLEDEDKRPFSIASSPQQLPDIELHIREMPGNEFTEAVIKKLQNSATIGIEGPLGNSIPPASISKEITMIVGGTGFAPAKSIIENLISTQSETKVNLFWGARNSAEIYALELAQQWHQDDYPVQFTPVIFEQDSSWEGDTGFVHKVAMEQLAGAIHQHHIYIAGSAEMVLAVYRDLLAAGISKTQIHADILDILREQGELD
jgi:NAD(P)H-flavin reductase